MRIATWNCCRGRFEVKAPLLDQFDADIAVIQECARPVATNDQCLWFGENKNIGMAVVARGAYRLAPLPPASDDVPKFAIPIQVRGPCKFTVLASWAQGGQPYPYVRAAVRAVQLYRDSFVKDAAVLIGDLNSNATWDKDYPPSENHSAMVRLLSDLGLVSSYHAYHREAHGEERQPTFHLHKREEKAFHIDYCFVPKRWVPRIRKVTVGSYADWKPYSDHRPLVVELDDEVAFAP